MEIERRLVEMLGREEGEREEGERKGGGRKGGVSEREHLWSGERACSLSLAELKPW